MPLKYDHLLGLEFDIDRRNCYELVRDFYHENYGIELTPYACPSDWWTRGMNLILALAEDEGFSLVHENPRHWRPGDVIVCAINSSRGNHCCVLLDNGQILHHLVGQRSLVTPYAGMFRNTTVAVYRHKDVSQDLSDPVVDIRDLLPLHVRRRLEAFGRAAPPEAPAGT